MATTHSHQTGCLTYQDALKQAHREARSTLGVALGVAAYFWISLTLTQDSSIVYWGFPLWFWTSIIGTVIVASVAVWVLTVTVFSDMDYDAAMEE